MAKTAAGKTVDQKELRAQAVANLSKHIQTYQTADVQGVGHWVNVPPDYDDWHFVRFNKQESYHREVAAVLLQQGYVECAAHKELAKVRCIGFESDGDNRHYLCCPPEVKVHHEKIKHEKMMRRFKLMEKDFGNHLSNVGGDVHIERRGR